jgi:hypothetical protein
MAHLAGWAAPAVVIDRKGETVVAREGPAPHSVEPATLPRAVVANNSVQCNKQRRAVQALNVRAVA